MQTNHQQHKCYLQQLKSITNPQSNQNPTFQHCNGTTSESIVLIQLLYLMGRSKQERLPGHVDDADSHVSCCIPSTCQPVPSHKQGPKEPMCTNQSPLNRYQRHVKISQALATKTLPSSSWSSTICRLTTQLLAPCPNCCVHPVGVGVVMFEKLGRHVVNVHMLGRPGQERCWDSRANCIILGRAPQQQPSNWHVKHIAGAVRVCSDVRPLIHPKLQIVPINTCHRINHLIHANRPLSSRMPMMFENLLTNSPKEIPLPPTQTCKSHRLPKRNGPVQHSLHLHLHASYHIQIRRAKLHNRKLAICQ